MSQIITDSQLAFVLQIKVKDARKMMEYCYSKTHDEVSEKPWEEWKNERGACIEVQNIEKVKNIDLTGALTDIKYNYLKRNQSRMWILDYPLKKWKMNDYGMYPKTISIPNPLASLMDDEVKKEVVSIWTKRFPHIVNMELFEGFKY